MKIQYKAIKIKIYLSLNNCFFYIYILQFGTGTVSAVAWPSCRIAVSICAIFLVRKTVKFITVKSGTYCLLRWKIQGIRRSHGTLIDDELCVYMLFLSN